ncbi:MAG: DUF58 domain-containing protein [Spirochaetota bacterium]
MAMDSATLLSKVKYIHLVSNKLVQSIFAGNYRSLFKGPGIEFDEVRKYVEGDDARLIDWNVSSRLSGVYTKTFKEERELILFLILDISASLFSGSSDNLRIEATVILSSLLSFAAVSNNDRVGAIFFSDRIEHWIPPRKGKKHVLRLIRDLLDIQPEGKGSNLNLALKTVNESLKRPGICVILSDFKTRVNYKELAHLSRKHDVIAVKIIDKTDEQFPASGLLEMQDPETGDMILGYGKSARFRKSYSDFWNEQHESLRQELHRCGVDTLIIRTDDDPVGRLLSFFKGRKKR